MPKVPVSNNVVPMLPPSQGGVAPPSPTMFAMAAATMANQQRSQPFSGDGKKLGTIVKGTDGRSRKPS